MENSLNPVVVKVENSLSLRLTTAVKDSSRSAISSVNQRNEEERNGAKARAANSDSAVIIRPTMTQRELLQKGTSCKKDAFYMQIMQGTELCHTFFVPCGANG